MRGRKPVPTAVKKLRGNPGHRALNKQEPKPPEGRPQRPSFLTKDAKKAWKTLVPILEEMGVLSTADGNALAGMCQCYSRWKQAEAEIDLRGITVQEPITGRDDSGDTIILGYKIKKNPACNISKEMLQQFRSFATLFGLDPSSRSRLRVGDKKDEVDPIQALLNQKKNSAAQVQ